MVGLPFASLSPDPHYLHNLIAEVYEVVFKYQIQVVSLTLAEAKALICVPIYLSS